MTYGWTGSALEDNRDPPPLGGSISYPETEITRRETKITP